MSYKTILSDFDTIRNNNEEVDVCIDLPKESGSVNINKNIISDDIILFKSRSHYKKKTFIKSLSKEENLSICINLDGQLYYKDYKLDETINKKANTMFVKYINNDYCSHEVKKDTKVNDIWITIKGEFLKKSFLEKLENVDQVQKNYEKDIPTLFKNKKTDIKTSILAHELWNSPYQGDLNKLFSQSKVYEIICNEFSDIFQKNEKPNTNIKLSKNDIEALYKAKSLISEEETFISLSQLAKKVTLNEFKLKYGFKTLFNTSPGAMALEYKMQKAKRLLQSSEYNINEISSIIGYKYVQGFTMAFKKRFGINPKELMKSRKYYY